MATAKKSASAKKSPAKKSAAKKGASAKGGATKSATKKTAAPARAKAPAKKAAAKKRAPNPAFMKAMTPSPELAAVVGDRPMPRTEVTKRVWDYIKKNDLQDAKNRRQINADDKLRPVFGGKKNVTMFDMTKMINQHLKD